MQILVKMQNFLGKIKILFDKTAMATQLNGGYFEYSSGASDWFFHFIKSTLKFDSTFRGVIQIQAKQSNFFRFNSKSLFLNITNEFFL